MREQIDAFLKDLSKKGLSENTIAAYRNDLYQLADYVEERARKERGVAARWGDLSHDFLLEYAHHELGQSKNYAAATVARKVSAIKSLFEFLSQAGVVKNSPSMVLKSPRIRRQPPQSISVEAVQKLLQQPEKSQTPEAKRDKAMLEFLYHTGMRVSEIVNLNVPDVNTEENYVVRQGRNSRSRTIGLPKETIGHLRAYLELGRPRLLRNRDEQALFLNRLGQRLTRQGFWQILKAHAEAANLGVKVTPRTLRHSLAAHMMHRGAELATIQERLGHANISTTQIYNHFAATPDTRSGK